MGEAFAANCAVRLVDKGGVSQLYLEYDCLSAIKALEPDKIPFPNAGIVHDANDFWLPVDGKGVLLFAAKVNL